MAIYKVIGVQNSQGVYKDNPYHNLMLQVEFKDDTGKKDFIGILVDAIKVKYSRLGEIFDIDGDTEHLPASYFQFLVGKRIKVYYDRYGSVDGITVIEDKPNPSAAHAK